ncbi:hypothetical protein XM79_c10270 [Vibrio vulnificus]|nr:hypothetical protein XM78_c10271 [Vibrio vulnificus]OQK68097.1 hypothetical protein XM79_c10270 [Vibrio vulnificus]
MRQDTSTATLSHKNQHPPPHPQPSFPCTRETIYPHAPDAAFENTLTTIDNCIEQNQQQHVNVAVTTSHTTRCTMGPRVHEDDKIKDRKRLIDRSYEEEVGITKMRQDTSTAPLSHKHSAHLRHATSCHSRAHGKPFIHTRRMPRLKTHSPQ